ncbi:MAG: response regulator [Bdellovibrionaceae bacterium]|jgi:two-component system, chemotaxis family, chemotaxis protein CheY|nr:response regulator [Pseudobdellovibrionaceae bacterium]
MSVSIAIVDDAAFIHEVYINLLKGTDIKIIAQAYDGLSAVNIIKESHPDVVLMDLVMPHLNGIDTTKKILQMNEKVKIIACSTLSQEHMIMKALEVGCVDYITKPFEKEDLINAIHKCMHKPQESFL